MTDLDTGTYDQLDFEEDDGLLTHAKNGQGIHQATTEVKEKSKLVRDEHTSDLEESMEDDGELKSEDDSDLNTSHSSEEGEVLSELEEVDATVEQSPAKEETPWERGVRLARERIQKLKALKATEKDIAEKRMNLAIPTVAAEEESDQASKEDILWPCYYQVAIIGRTELTGLRFLPEDLQPPTANEIAEWRLGLSDSRRGRQRRHRARGSSRSVSSSGSSSSAATSRSSSTDSLSAASSLHSVAASWKATCAQAMKDYLSSPIRNKDRRGGRGRGSRHSRSLSSGSDSQSSDSRSASDQSDDHAVRHAYRTSRGAVGDTDKNGRESRRYWAGTKQSSRQSRSESERSSKSRSDSRSSASSRENQHPHAWNYDDRHARRGENWQKSPERSESPSSPVRRRSDVPPLPHERPVKRPWVAAPGMATGLVTNRTGRVTRQRSGSSSRSRSRSSPAGEERQFITSWSRSPSSGAEARSGREPVRRERLPDVVPGSHTNRARRPASPSVRRKKSRSPFAEDQSSGQQRSVVSHTTESVSTYDEPSVPRHTPQAQPCSETPVYVDQQVPVLQHPQQPSERETATAAPSQQTPVVGELPSASSRPGVKITLAPRLKSSAVDMTSLAGGVSRPAGRTNQPSPPPRLPRLPFPIPVSNQTGVSMTSISGSGETPITIDQEEIRRQAEAAAAIVEARERRRAAAEAARRRRNPKKKRDDLSKIPIRGRPTYRRVSFSDSSLESGSSKSSRSSSRTGSTSRSGSASSGEPQTFRVAEPETIQQNSNMLSQRPRKSHKKSKIDNSSVQSGFAEFEQMGSHRSRNIQRGMPGDLRATREEFPERHQRRSKMNFGMEKRHRNERAFEPDQAFFKPNAGVPVYDFDNNLAFPTGLPRHRAGKTGMVGAVRHRNVNEDFMQEYQETSRSAARRPGGPSHPMERVMRPRTPHADGDMDGFTARSSAGVIRPSKHERKRMHERGIEGEPVRKRAMIAEPVMEPAVNVELRQARSRHRSRGPGGPIDRSEPFESDAGSFAAEQRLRELRERLNFVDDAIAELRAGANLGFADSRR